MARASIRRRFLVGSIASTLLALTLFAASSLVWVWLDDVDLVMDDGDTFRDEAMELVAVGMLVAAPLALIAAVVGARLVGRRVARPVEDAIRAARETTAHDLRRTLAVPEREDELRELIVALNDLFVRLDDGFGALARFAADASHELRTPLAVMSTELEVALRHRRTVDEWEVTGRSNLEELRRLSRVVEGLLTLARAGADAPGRRMAVRIVERVDAVIAQLAATAERAGVTLVGPAEETGEEVVGDPVMLETAIRNLVENALAAVPAGGRVVVGISASPAEVSITVDDDGPGITDDDEALFVPFHRSQPRRVGAGVGLGLAIVRRIASAHGGRVNVEGSPLRGARFVLAIPVR
ncbi:MAG: HAMP domain-containing protein [Deltaproteobacteria bacterium]|nr:HAMP domain-containing protein [Deltaproteobacteria bacterium]